MGVEPVELAGAPAVPRFSWFRTRGGGVDGVLAGFRPRLKKPSFLGLFCKTQNPYEVAFGHASSQGVLDVLLCLPTADAAVCAP